MMRPGKMPPTSVLDSRIVAPVTGKFSQEAVIGPMEPEEVLIIDAGSNLTPAQMVERKLLTLLGTTRPGFFSQAPAARSPCLFGPRGRQLP
jgi:hypothetical protein